MSLSLLLLAAAAPPQAASPPAPPPIVRQDETLHLDHSPASRREFIAGLNRSAGADVLAAVRRNFPEEYEALIDRLLDVAINSGGDSAVAREGAFREMALFVRGKSADVLNAPAADLLALNERTLAFYRAAGTVDVALCGRFAANGIQDSRGMAPGLMPQMSAISVATIDAAGAGHRAADHPAGRGTLVPQDAVAWMAQMRSLDTANEALPLLADPAALARAAPAAQCRLGTMIYEAIRRLPPEQGARVFAFMLSQAFGSQHP
jgi:hypothetical protein